MASIDLTGIPVIDNHCHGLYRDQGPFDPVTWRRFFTESHDPEMARDLVDKTVFYRRLLRQLADFLECEPSEEAVLAMRRAWSHGELIRSLLQTANIDTLLIDGGYPPPARVLAVPSSPGSPAAGCCRSSS